MRRILAFGIGRVCAAANMNMNGGLVTDRMRPLTLRKNVNERIKNRPVGTEARSRMAHFRSQPSRFVVLHNGAFGLCNALR
jgi:hypothetical protein